MPHKEPDTLPFPASQFTIEAYGKTYPFVLPADPDAVLDSIPETAYQKDQFLPYWAEHWPSSGPFFSYIMRNGLPGSTSVVELGCGLGVLSAALSLQDVLSIGIDISPESCQFAHHNIRTLGGLPRILCADWRSLPLKAGFDLLIASDVLYEERWIPVILDSIDTLVKPGGNAWIADPCRRFWKSFKDTARNKGFTVSQLHLETLTSSATTVEIIELQKG